MRPGRNTAADRSGAAEPTAADAETVCRRVRCPVLVIHGDRDQVVPYETGVRLAEWTVGGSGVGTHLLRRVARAYPHAEKLMPGLRMIAVTGPRIDPASVPVPPGVELFGYVPDLHRHLTACDVAVVQGGLTTTMELVAAR